MDGITIAWYISTFSIVLTFIIVIALTKRRCLFRSAPRDISLSQKPPQERPVAPMTPAPAYSEFAPPSYEDAIRKMSETNSIPPIFVISINEKTPKMTSNPVLIIK